MSLKIQNNFTSDYRGKMTHLRVWSDHLRFLTSFIVDITRNVMRLGVNSKKKPITPINVQYYFQTTLT